MSNKKMKKSQKPLSLLLSLVMAVGLLQIGLFTVPADAAGTSGTLVTEVNFTVREPVGSENPNYDIECDNDKVQVFDAQWIKGGTGTGKVLDENDVFVYNDIYTLRFYLCCKDNYTFSVDCVVKVNGEVSTLREADGMPGCYYIMRGYQAKNDQLAYVPEDSTVHSWTVLTCTDDEVAFNWLKQFLLDDGNVYSIRLGGDLEYEVGNNVNTVFYVHGKKYLDLNGHDLYIRRDNGYTSTMFEIIDGAELVIIDSAGGGTIRYDGYIFDGADYDAGHLAVRHIFDVYGKLTINGGKIMGGGRSKKQWLANAVTEGYVGGGGGGVVTIFQMYNGYVRNQVNGIGVIVRNGGELVVNGGDVTGRGFLSLDKTGISERACAIYGKNGSTITLNDGYFKGYGCADVLQFDLGKNCNLTIRAGTFDTHKIDNVRLPNVYSDDGYDPIWNRQNPNQMSGSYGDIGIPAGAVVPGAKLIVGGEEQEADEEGNVSADETSKKTYVKPQDEFTSSTSYVRSVKGITKLNSYSSEQTNISTGMWTVGTTGMLMAEFYEKDFYWEQGILAKACTAGYKQKNYMVWEVRNSYTGKLVAEITSPRGNYTLNLNCLEDKNGNLIPLESGKMYDIAGYLMEEWNGKYDYTAKHLIGHYKVQAVSADYGSLADDDVLDISQEGYFKNTTGENNARFVVTLSDTLTSALADLKTAGEITDWYVTLTYKDSEGGYRYDCAERLTADRTSAPISIGAPGIATLESKVFVTTAGGTLIPHSQKQDLLIFSDITPGGNYRWDAEIIPSVELNDPENFDAYVRLDAGFDKMVEMARNVYGGDLFTGRELNPNDIYWEYMDNGEWVRVDGHAGMIYGSDEAYGETNNYLYVRVGYTSYRACFQIGDTVFTSPRPMQVVSDVEYDNYPIKITASTDSTTYGDGATITVDLTPAKGQISSWSHNLTYVFKCVSKPVGARVINNWYDNVSDPDIYLSNGGKTLNVDAFFAENPSRVRPGAYTYRVTVYDENTGTHNANGTITGQVRRTSYDVTITYEYTATDADVYIDGVNISNQTDDGCYIMPGNTEEITLETKLYPEYSTQLPSGKRNYTAQWQIVNGQDVGEIVEQGRTARFVAKKPGKATLCVAVIDNRTQFTYLYVDIIVPIAGFTVEEPELVVGEYVSSFLPEITSVWSYGGEKITQNVGYYLEAVHLSGSKGKVAINTNYNATYQFTPVGDNRFPAVKIEDEIYGTIYEADMNAISMNTFDSDSVSPIAGRGYSVDSTIRYVPEEVYVNYDYTYDWVRDPNAQYIDFISATQTEPKVGDTAVYSPGGHSIDTVKFLAGQVNFGGAPFDYASNVFPVTELRGSGIPYDDASANYTERVSTTNYTPWYINAFAYAMSPEESPTEQFYAEGIHMNDLQVYTADGADGTVYYFSPDVTLVVNGHNVKVNYNTGDRIRAEYYFDVGNVEIYDGITVEGIEDPVGGEKPTTDADTACLNLDRDEHVPIYVSRLTWFIDANGNNKCDEGEEAMIRPDEDGNYDADASGLNEDGTFKYNTAYKVLIVPEMDEHATGRMAQYDFKTKINTTGGIKDTLVLFDTNGVPLGAVYAYDRTGDEPLTKYEASFTAKEGTISTEFAFDPIPRNNTHHFGISSYYYMDANGETLAVGSTLEDGKSYKFVVNFAADSDNGYSFPDDFTVIIDGKTLTGGVTVTAGGYYLEIVYPFTVGESTGTTDLKVVPLADALKDKYTVSGQTVTVTYDYACKVGYLDGGKYKAIAATDNGDGSYSFTAPDGVEEVILVVKGDVDGDGVANTADKTVLTRSLLDSAHPAHRTLNEEEAFALDVDNDGTIGVSDKTLLTRSVLPSTHPAYKALSW